VELVAGSPPSAILEISIENRSDKSVGFPIGTSPADFESKGADIPYSFESVLISVRPNTRLRTGLRIDPLSLYGSESVRGSLIPVHPGESLQIRLRAALEANASTVGDPGALNIYPSSPPENLDILFEHNTVGLEDGILHQDSRQVYSLAY
jgi:hypothetical protein